MSAPADALTALKAAFPQVTDRASGDHPAVNVPAAEVLAVLRYLRDTEGYDMLVDLTAIDWAEDVSPRFTVVYHLLSTARHGYIRVATSCANDAEPVVPSVTGLWAGANWHEREAYDMFGHHVWRPSRPATDPDVGRLSVFSAAQGVPLGRSRNAVARPRSGCGDRRKSDLGADDGRPVRRLSG